MVKVLPDLLYRWVPPDFENFRWTDIIDVVPGFQVEMGTYTFTGKGKNMTAEEYLSTEKGVGGNITGFFEYIDNQPRNIQEGRPSYINLGLSHAIFGRGRNLILLPGGEVEKAVKVVRKDYSLEEIVTPIPGVLQVSKLGSLMQTPFGYGQDAEWDFSTSEKLEVPALILRFGNYGPKVDGIRNFQPSQDINFNNLIRYINSSILPRLPPRPVSGQGRYRAKSLRASGRKKRTRRIR